MELRELERLVVDALEDVKAQDIQVFDTQRLSSMFSRVVIATGTSTRHTRSLSENVRDKVKQAGGYIGNMEGEDSGEWVLLDCGEVVVHVLQPSFRDYYNLEELWGERPISLQEIKQPVAKAVVAKKVKSSTPATKKPVSATAVKKKAPAKTAVKKSSQAPKVAAKKTRSKSPTA